MRIIITDTTIHGPLIGGAQTFLPLLMKGLKEKGHEVHLVTKGDPDKRIAKQINSSGAILHTNLFKKNALVENEAPAFADWVNKMQPNIYLISVSPDIGWVVLPYLNSSIATFTIGHTDSETFYAPVRHYHSFITKAIAVSDQVSERYVDDCKLSKDQVNWIPYGVNVNAVPPAHHSDEMLNMIYVGRIDETQKRISDLAAIAKKLTQQNISFQLKVIGDGPAMATFKENLSAEIASGKVKLTGWLDNAEVVKALIQSDVFVLTSEYEGFCIALVEAMANGCSPVATDIRSGNKQLIKNTVNGFLIEIGNVDGFADKLKFLQQNPLALAAMREAAWQTGKQYSVSNMVSLYEKCFEEGLAAIKTTSRKADPHFPIIESCRSKYPQWLRRVKGFVKNLANV